MPKLIRKNAAPADCVQMNDGALRKVTGHADRLGSDKYNQKLSERRAAAVKTYLASQGVAADRVKTEGKGEAMPNPDADTANKCKGNKKTKKLIECLQPDRRVTVEPEIQVPTKK